MNRNRWITAVLTLTTLSLAVAVFGEKIATESMQRKKAQKEHNKGNYRDAYNVFSKLATNPKCDPAKVSSDLTTAIDELPRLNRINEIDAFREKVIAAHAKNWKLLWTAGRSYTFAPGQVGQSIPKHGYMIAGQFRRGGHRGGGKLMNCYERDRVRALQLMRQAEKNIPDSADHKDVGKFYLDFAAMLLNYRNWQGSWRLGYLTNLKELPDYENGYGHRHHPYSGYAGGSRGAPVDEKGNPIYYTRPTKWQDAQNDGQRWRWCLTQAVELDSGLKKRVKRHFADFLYNQFGVQTMAQYSWWFGRSTQDQDAAGKKKGSGTWELHTLKDNETIARLATGVKRFTLPEEFNFVRMYKELNAWSQLGGIYENRRQYDKAVTQWKKGLTDKQKELHDAGQFEYAWSGHPNRTPWQRVSQILGNWGHFEPVMTQPAGSGATVQFRFRNGKKVEFEAFSLKIEQLLQDVKAHLKTKPRQDKHQDRYKWDVNNIGYRIVQKNQKKYINKLVASWSLDLKPRPGHFDKRITVTTPLQKAGAYLLKAKMADGNVSHIVVWLADTVIVRKPMNGKMWYYVADARNGKPIEKANVEFFGYDVDSHWQRIWRKYTYTWKFKNFAEYTDKDGQLVLGSDRMPQNYRWLTMARTKEGRLAYLGFQGVWYRSYHPYHYGKQGLFFMTDRPVYRPKQSVKWKFWLNKASYDAEGKSPFAGRKVWVRINNPRGEKVKEHYVTLDEYGGANGELALKQQAMLGMYYLQFQSSPKGRWYGRGSFRVEEYKKPEYEVTVEAPKDPVALGDKIAATIKAKYYFGGAVTDAKVKYKILRTEHSANWYPRHRWDWLFGGGFWWFGYDYHWYPGFAKWGCVRPYWPWWGWRPQPQPELVAEREVKIGADGSVKVEIDTALAKAMYGDRDHKYEITAEVRDASRRTIVGKGSVLVARRPFKVYAWVDRGFYKAGDTIGASFQARRLDGKGVQGSGALKLMKIDYKKDAKSGVAKPVETAVQTWKLNTDEDGQASLQIKAAQPGQYRLSYTVTSANKHKIEGGYVFSIWGDKATADDFRFNSLELSPDKKTYKPGDKLNLRINTNKIGSTVLLFTRPSGGCYPKPKMIQLKGRSVKEVIDIAKADMPNFFIEAMTIADGKVHTEVRQVTVPPEKRVLDVKIQPTKSTYKPGEKAKVKVKLTDAKGEPFQGSVVLTMYDKAVEYISGGSNVGDIKKFFWNWKRSHSPNTLHSLQKTETNMVLPHHYAMSYLGIFGRSNADEPGVDAKPGGATFGAGSKSEIQRFLSPARTIVRKAKAAEMVADCDAPAVAMEPMMKKKNSAAGGGQSQQPQVAVRTKFADTAKWVSTLTTGKDGWGEVELTMPENLTTWKTKVWAMGHGCRVGEGSAEVLTTKDLICRLQAPRFFVQGDEVVLSAVVMNRLKAAKTVKVSLGLSGKLLQVIGSGKDASMTKAVEIPTDGSKRVDWRVKVLDEGEVKITMSALTIETSADVKPESDAMAMTFPVYVHGMLKTESFSGVIRPDGKSGSITIRVPKERRPEQSQLEVRYSPTLAGAMVDALPYLVEYPYGCTEQTLNKFLPTVITQKAITRMGVDLADVSKKITNLNAQEIGDDAKRMKDWKRLIGTHRWNGKAWVDRNPVFEKGEVDRMVKFGIDRLTSMQCSDGGWGWFSGWGERSYPHTTAVVVHGLLTAKANDVAIVPGVIQRGVDWLKRYEAEQLRLLKRWEAGKKSDCKRYADNLDALVRLVLNEAKNRNAEMRKRLYRDRNASLSLYGKSLLGLSCHMAGDKKKLAMVMKNLEQYLVQDEENQTAYLKLPEGSYWWSWYGSEIETMAWYLKLLAAVEPKGQRASRLVKYLLNNRRHGTYWNSTRDTAYCVEAFADYLKNSGEDKPDMTVEILVDGKVQKTVKINKDNLFSFDNKFVLTGKAVTTGKHTVEIRRKGSGPVYYNAYLTNFTLEDPIAKAGLEIRVQRKYYKLVRVDKTVKAEGSRGQALDKKVEKYKRIKIPNPFNPLAGKAPTIESGDLLEIELIIESKNDYEYIIFEDFKAAGCEPVALRSGYGQNEMGAFMELRDNRVCFFVRRLARGKHSISYRMRAEIPGKFSALPTKASAMYAPELKANSDEDKLTIIDEKD